MKDLRHTSLHMTFMYLCFKIYGILKEICLLEEYEAKTTFSNLQYAHMGIVLLIPRYSTLDVQYLRRAIIVSLILRPQHNGPYRMLSIPNTK